MQAIQEENHVDNDQQDYNSTSIKRTQQQGKTKNSIIIITKKNFIILSSIQILVHVRTICIVHILEVLI